MQGSNLTPKYVAILAVASACILIVGSLIRPKTENRSEAPISEIERARLQILAQRRTLQDTGAFLASSGQGYVRHVAYLPELRRNGVAWAAGGRVLVPSSASTPVAGQAKESAIELFVAGTPIREISIPGDARITPVNRNAPPDLDRGEWLVLVARDVDGDPLVLPAFFLGEGSATCAGLRVRELRTSTPPTEPMLGGGAFNLDGALVGIVVQCGRGFAIMSAGDVPRALNEADTLPNQLRRRLGMAAVPLPESARELLRAASGIYVSELWNNGPAERAGIRVGDVIETLDATAVSRIDALGLLLTASKPALRIRRFGKPLEVRLDSPMSPDLQQELPLGLPADPIAAYIDLAQLEPGDRILQVNQIIGPDLATLLRIVRQRSSLFVVIGRGQRKLGFFRHP